MKQLALLGPRTLELQEVEEPVAGPGEVLVRVAACGICGSDVHAYEGRHPFVIYPVVQGHELSGTVEVVGPGVDEALAGSRVVVEPSLFCGVCPQCRSGRYNICGDLRVMGFQAPGAMCELFAVPAGRLHRLPPGVGLLQGALAEPCAVAVHALARSGVGASDSVAVLGAGVIGTMMIKVAKAAGCQVISIEKDAALARRAAESGADMSLVAGEDTARAVTGATEGRLAAVFECVGGPATLRLAVEMAPRGSTLVVVGVFSGPVSIQAALVQDGELDVKGTLMYTGDDFERALDLLAAGALDSSGFITATVPLEGVEEAYRLLLDQSEPTMKVMVEPGG